MFARGAQFFALDDKVKAAVPCDPATFVGWERDAEVSPATGQHAGLPMLCPGHSHPELNLLAASPSSTQRCAHAALPYPLVA